MIELKPDEIRLWEQVYTAYIGRGIGGNYWNDRCKTAGMTADAAVEGRRERFNVPKAYQDPYRGDK